MFSRFAVATLLTIAPVFGQEPATVEPVRIALLVEGEAPHHAELDKLLRRALKNLAEKPKPGEGRRAVDIAFVSLSADYSIEIAVAPIDPDTGYTGVVGSLYVTDSTGWRMPSIYTAKDLNALAALIVKQLDRKYFQPHQRK